MYSKQESMTTNFNNTRYKNSSDIMIELRDQCTKLTLCHALPLKVYKKHVHLTQQSLRPVSTFYG